MTDTRHTETVRDTARPDLNDELNGQTESSAG